METQLKPNNTAERTALWRALHKMVDPAPPIVDDTIGLTLLNPTDDWKSRPDMDIAFTKRVRVSMATRARFIDDLVKEYIFKGINQYVILGAGIDTFAQRNKTEASLIQIFEIDQKETLLWKQKRLLEEGFEISPNLHFVPFDFETKNFGWESLTQWGFDIEKPTIVVCTGVIMYLTDVAINNLFETMSKLASTSVFVFTFLLPIEYIEEQDKQLMQISMQGAERAGNPFKSMFKHQEILNLVQKFSFNKVSIVSKAELLQRYFVGRNDQLEPASDEDFVIAVK